MITYQEVTSQIADQWVSAFKRTEDAVSNYAETVQKARATLDVPSLPIPELLTNLNKNLGEKLPKPSEIIAANFDFASRVLTAQRDLALRLVEDAEKVAGSDTTDS
ncbi:hypothetical protein [Mycolicibacterium thermoresistibile]